MRETLDKLHELHENLEASGFSPLQALLELSLLLFLKMCREPEINWFMFNAIGGGRIATYRNSINSLQTSSNHLLRDHIATLDCNLQDEALFDSLLEGINSLDWVGIREYGTGCLFEQFLEEYAEHAEHAAVPFSTPLLLVNSLVGLLQPEPGEIIHDPAAGSGGFLMAAAAYLDAVVRDEYVGKPGPPPYLSGLEKSSQQRAFAAMNAILHEVELNALHSHANTEVRTEGNVDVLFSNLLDSDTGHQGRMLEAAVRRLKPNGRALFIVNDELLHSPQTKALRYSLLEHGTVHTLLRLPNGLFFGHDCAAHVLFYNRGGSTSDIWCYDMRSRLPWFDACYAPFEPSHLHAFEQAYGNSPKGQSRRRDSGEHGRFRCFKRNELDATLNLDICWLPEEPQTTPDIQSFPVPQRHSRLLSNTLHELIAIKEMLDSPFPPLS